MTRFALGLLATTCAASLVLASAGCSADPGPDPDRRSAAPPPATQPPATPSSCTNGGSAPFFAGASFEEATTFEMPESNGDLWASCWADDDALYVANGDGRGFGAPSDPVSDVAVGRIHGSPLDPAFPPHGEPLARADQLGTVWTAPAGPVAYNRKPTSMLCRDGVLYLAVQDLAKDFDDAPALSISKSTDKGRTWTWDRSAPMFDAHVFTTVMFLDYGKDSANAIDDYVYAYGLDDNWRYSDRVASPTRLYLARVPKTNVTDRSKWAFYAGPGPTWSASIDARAPVLEDGAHVYADTLDPAAHPRDMTVLGQGSVVYDAPLRRYLYTSWTEFTFELYEAPAPWGPWSKVLSQDFGVYPWTADKHGGYAVTAPSKLISADGKTLLVQANTIGALSGVDRYHVSMRKLHLEPAAPSCATNAKSFSALGKDDAASIPIARASHFGRASTILDDGITTGESDDSWNGESKTEDFWGWTWPRTYNVDRVVFTPGDVFPAGGWFEDPRVQVRQNGTWVDVTNACSTPEYAGAATKPGTPYLFTFDPTWGDAVRVVGKPGGSATFTSVSELTAHYANFTEPFDQLDTRVWQTSPPAAGAIDGGAFVLHVDASRALDEWSGVDDAPKLLRTDMGNGDWSIETDVTLADYAQGSPFQTGLAARLDGGDVLLWGAAHGDELDLSRNGAGKLVSVPGIAATTVWLRLRKSGTSYAADYKTSRDAPWTSAGRADVTERVTGVGLLTKTWQPTAVTARFDDFALYTLAR